jgi:hypothetical protein
MDISKAMKLYSEWKLAPILLLLLPDLENGFEAIDRIANNSDFELSFGIDNDNSWEMSFVCDDGLKVRWFDINNFISQAKNAICDNFLMVLVLSL